MKPAETYIIKFRCIEVDRKKKFRVTETSVKEGGSAPLSVTYFYLFPLIEEGGRGQTSYTETVTRHF